MHQFKNLRIWQQAMNLTEAVYRLTKDFPKEEKYGLTSQLQRAAVSIPSNIAEGAYRNSNREFNHFLGIASGSAGEVYTQLEIANRLGYLEDQQEELTQLLETSDALKRMIFKFQKQLTP